MRDAFRHRLVLSYQALAEEVTADQVLDEVLEAIATAADRSRPHRHRRGVKGLDRRSRPRADARASGARARSRPRASRRSSSRSAAGSTGCSPATTARRSPASAPSSTRCGPYEAGRRRPPDRLERHRAHRHRRTSASSSPSGCSSPGSSSTRSASMAFGTAERRKADVAEGVALAIGHAATRRGNRLGLVAFGAEDPRWRRPRQGRRGLLLTLAALRDEPAGKGGLGEALLLARRARGPALAGRDRLRLPRPDRLAARRCCASPAGIRRSPSRSATRASRSSPTSASSGSSIPRPAASCGSTRADRNLRERFAVAAAEERTGLVRMLSSAGVRHVALSTEGDWLRPLAAFLKRSDRLMLCFVFSFKSPWLLLFLLVVPVAVVGYIWLERQPRRQGREAGRPRRCSRTWSRARRAPGGTSRRSSSESRFVLLLVGFARPQAKFSEAKDGATVVLMVDISGSMGANDVKPTRLLAAGRGGHELREQAPVEVPRGAGHLLQRDRGEGAADLRPQDADQGPADEGRARGHGARRRARPGRHAWRRRRSARASRASRTRRRRSCSSPTAAATRAASSRPQAASAARRRRAFRSRPSRSARPAGVVHQNVPLGQGKKTFPLVQQVPVDPKVLQPGRARRAAARSTRPPLASELDNVYKDLGSRLVYSKQYREITVGVTLARFRAHHRRRGALGLVVQEARMRTRCACSRCRRRPRRRRACPAPRPRRTSATASRAASRSRGRGSACPRNGEIVFALDCPEGKGIVAGIDGAGRARSTSARASTAFSARPVAFGRTTHTSALFRAVSAHHKAGSFKPFIGCIPSPSAFGTRSQPR